MNSIHVLSIVAIGTILIGSMTIDSSVFAENGKTPISLIWDPADTSTDPNNLIIVNGAFTRIGLISDSTNDVQGQLDGKISQKTDNESEKIVTNNAGSTTIETTVTSHSTKAPKLDGAILIDGEIHDVSFKPNTDAHFSNVDESITTSSGSQTSTQSSRTISGSISLCDSEKNCMEGFAIIHSESSEASAGGITVTFNTDTLEAEIIGEDGLFELRMNKLQRIVS